ncbi:thiol-disulfide oxidoreductase DCC family protein [Echinicola jeungdonensis]|uniref:Thiol-disulfide oxidoreductase DCC family protein n=1 Tax=Echinicola jeungdonensis TaxID=709343 RepID=A0ABV5J3Z0_9BACT|nr:thiol-disulfide oxidoreductase DCC family protein [Echinicola jeungdonensis]MDN3667964.1 thiol-disulfide oxidoreductase DCC family protein [Echinicola jeungdonensis]
MPIQEKYDIVLFDGVCNLCNTAVDFIIQRDPQNQFKLASLQDEASKKLLKDYSVEEDYLDSIILIRGENVYYKSRAALEIAKKLKGLWPLFYGFVIIPTFLRDPIYDWIARNRYKWFGKRETCRMPSEEDKLKFLTAEEV